MHLSVGRAWSKSVRWRVSRSCVMSSNVSEATVAADKFVLPKTAADVNKSETVSLKRLTFPIC
jgi:hypothetical protein